MSCPQLRTCTAKGDARLAVVIIAARPAVAVCTAAVLLLLPLLPLLSLLTHYSPPHPPPHGLGIVAARRSPKA
jgi:uncharacterized membrane protein YdfJ with MMPL/SSD domain